MTTTPEPFDAMDDDARIAYWLNAYNATLIRSLAIHPRTGSLLHHRGPFRDATTTVAGLDFSLDQIEHGLLRGNRRRPYSLRRPLRPGDPRLLAAPSVVDPRIHFSLNCGARSCPPVRTYTASGIHRELAGATAAYLDAEADLNRDAGRLILPGLIKLYRRDFGHRGELLDFVATHSPEPEARWLSEHGDELRIGYTRFDWRLTGPANREGAEVG